MKRAIYPIVFATLLLLSSTAPGESSLSPADYLELREDAERAYRDRDAESATALYLQLTEVYPGDSEMWYGLSRAYEWSGDLPRAISTAVKVQKLGFVSRASLSYRLAQLNAMAGHTDDLLDGIVAVQFTGVRVRAEADVLRVGRADQEAAEPKVTH